MAARGLSSSRRNTSQHIPKWRLLPAGRSLAADRVFLGTQQRICNGERPGGDRKNTMLRGPALYLASRSCFKIVLVLKLFKFKFCSHLKIVLVQNLLLFIKESNLKKYKCENCSN
jgi:hypothetical protein